VVASELAQYVATGLLVGGVYALMSIGLALIFGVMRVLNVGHGELLMLGGYVSYFAFTTLGVDPYLSVALSAITLFALGLVLNAVLFRYVEQLDEEQVRRVAAEIAATGEIELSYLNILSHSRASFCACAICDTSPESVTGAACYPRYCARCTSITHRRSVSTSLSPISREKTATSANAMAAKTSRHRPGQAHCPPPSAASLTSLSQFELMSLRPRD